MKKITISLETYRLSVAPTKMPTIVYAKLGKQS